MARRKPPKLNKQDASGEWTRASKSGTKKGRKK